MRATAAVLAPAKLREQSAHMSPFARAAPLVWLLSSLLVGCASRADADPPNALDSRSGAPTAARSPTLPSSASSGKNGKAPHWQLLVQPSLSPALSTEGSSLRVWVTSVDGSCVVLDESTDVFVGEKRLETVSSGKEPGLLSKYNRYAACELPTFDLAPDAAQIARSSGQLNIQVAGPLPTRMRIDHAGDAARARVVVCDHAARCCLADDAGTGHGCIDCTSNCDVPNEP